MATNAAALIARLEHLPIFPLPSVQLFPHAILPLHVFEPRYRELLRDCLASDRVFAVAAIEPGDEERGSPAVRLVCGVGEVIAHEPLEGGRSNILLHGVARARIVRELVVSGPYRVVRATSLADHYPPTGTDLTPPVRSLVALADQLAARLPSGGDTLRALARTHDDPGALTDVLAAALVTDPAARQRLLEDADVVARLEAVTTAIATTLARFSDDRSRSN